MPRLEIIISMTFLPMKFILHTIEKKTKGHETKIPVHVEDKMKNKKNRCGHRFVSEQIFCLRD